MSLSVNTVEKQKSKEEADKMSVILKQRTAKTKEGRACLDTDLEARFIVGPKGGKITDETAKALGLINGKIPTKEQRERQDKEIKRHEDKTGRTSPKPGREINPVDPNKNKKEADPVPGKDANAEQVQDRTTRIKTIIYQMIEEAYKGGQKVREKLFTAGGSPDSRVISTRLGEQVSADDRDMIWEQIKIEPLPDEYDLGEDVFGLNQE